MVGTDLAGEVHRIRQDIPIILCTGYGEWLTGSRTKEVGITELMMKPISVEDLAKTIRSILDAKQARVIP